MHQTLEITSKTMRITELLGVLHDARKKSLETFGRRFWRGRETSAQQWEPRAELSSITREVSLGTFATRVRLCMNQVQFRRDVGASQKIQESLPVDSNFIEMPLYWTTGPERPAYLSDARNGFSSCARE